MIPKSIYAILKAASKFTKAGGGDKMRFSSHMGYSRLPSDGPIMNIAKATAKGPMNRREFLGRSRKITNELNMQRKLARAAVDLKKEQARANAWLTSPDTIRKIEQSNIARGQLSEFSEIKQTKFHKKLIEAIQRSEGRFEPSFRRIAEIEGQVKAPKKAIDKWFYWRQKLANKYGHSYGTGTYLNKTFDTPNASVPYSSYSGGWSSQNSSSKGILDYINQLKETQGKKNPILEAFKEGLYG